MSDIQYSIASRLTGMIFSPKLNEIDPDELYNLKVFLIRIPAPYFFYRDPWQIKLFSGFPRLYYGKAKVLAQVLFESLEERTMGSCQSGLAR